MNNATSILPAQGIAAVALFGFMFRAWHAKPALLHMDIKK